MSCPAPPDRQAFRAMAASHGVVPVWRQLVADLSTPVAAFMRLCAGDEPGFLFESVEHGQRWGRWSFVGRRPWLTLTARGASVTAEGDLPDGVPLDTGILAAIEAVVAAVSVPEIEGLPPLHAGVVGYLGYDVVREVENLGPPPGGEAATPDAVMAAIGELAAFDHFAQRVILLVNARIPPGADDAAIDAAYDAAMARLDQLAADGAAPLDEPMLAVPADDPTLPDVESSMGHGAYQHAVGVAKGHILAGDIFQVVLSQRFSFDLGADPFDAYRVLRQVNPSPYMYFVRTPDVSLAGSSPEPLVTLRNGRVTSRPIAGTRRRGNDPDHEQRLIDDLLADPKERAEHVMLLDLARNDVGRVVRFGSEQVDEMMVLERYSHVMHLTSQVSGELAPGATAIDVLRATLPAGTVSGAPKVRAMEIIDDLEPTRRGPYAGVVGYLDFSGNLDVAIAIRTLVVPASGPASVQAGAGVVADSVPELEDLECHNKARAVLAAVAGARAMASRRS